MRNRLRFWSDRYDYALLSGIRKEPADEIFVESQAGKSLSQLAATLSTGGGSPSTDLALDLLLHEIAEQVRLSTGATGVAIALTRSGNLVCRAATGSAPDLGARLNPHAGLSGLCLQTKTLQRSDDTERDSRVDAAACRNLRIRSILMAPVMRRGEAVGLLEAFSANPGHFRDRDIEILLSFCKQVVNHLNHAEVVSASKLSVAPPEARKANAPNTFKKSRSWELGAVFLTTAVIAAALLLGWVIGRVDRHRVDLRNPPSPNTRIQQRARDQKIHNEAATEKVTNAAVKPAKPPPQMRASLPHKSIASNPPSLSVSKNSAEGIQDGALVVYENGSVVFREKPPVRPGSTMRGADSRTGADVPPGAIIPASRTELLTAEDANQYVIHRVQPRYPELARQQRIQGAVLLKVLVGKDGGVQQVQALSGDPKLAAAAADAVVQWRFNPVLRLGQSVEFQTEITVDFKLP